MGCIMVVRVSMGYVLVGLLTAGWLVGCAITILGGFTVRLLEWLMVGLVITLVVERVVSCDVMVEIARLIGFIVTSSVAWHALWHVWVFVRLVKVWLRRRVCHRIRLSRFSQISFVQSVLLLRRRLRSLGLRRRVDRIIWVFMGLMPGLQSKQVGLFVGIAILEGLLVGRGWVDFFQRAFHHHSRGLGRFGPVQPNPELENLVFFL